MNKQHLATFYIGARTQFVSLLMATGFGLLLNSAGASAQLVHVQVNRPGGTEYGAGNSVGKGPECFIVTPLHVIEDAETDAITITSSKNERAKARVIKQTNDFDIALLKLEDNAHFECPEDWDDGSDLAKLVRKEPFLIAKKINSNGRVEQNRLFVSAITAETIELEPADKKNRLQEGDSGSSIYAGERLVGIVSSVDTATGTVLAITQNQLHGIFGNDVLPQDRLQAILIPFRDSENNSENIYATSAAHDYLITKTPLMLNEFSSTKVKQLTSDELPPPPKGINYIISGRILHISVEIIDNPEYSAEDKGKKSIFQSFIHRLAELPQKALDIKSEPYIFNYNIDIEVQVRDTSPNSPYRKLERLSYHEPGNDSNKNELQKKVIRKAVTESLQKTFGEYKLPVKQPGLFDNLSILDH